MLSLTVKQITQKNMNDLSQKPNDQSPKTGQESIFPSFRGGMTPEASLVVPIFILFLMSILMSVEMVRLRSDVSGALHQGVSVTSVSLSEPKGILTSREYMCLPHCRNPVLRGEVRFESESNSEFDGMIRHKAEFVMKPFIGLFGIGDIDGFESITGHSFSGYTGNEEAGGFYQTQEYVFVTLSGTKYHRNADCIYLRVRPEAVNYDELSGLRNNNGHKYYPCERCHPISTGVVLITPEGTVYHSKADCPSLKRTLRVISLSEAVENGYLPCSGCG